MGAAHEAYARAQALAPRRSSGTTSTRSSCSVSRGTRTRACREAALASRRTICRRVKLAEALLEAGDLREPSAVRALVGEPAASRPPKSASDASPPPKGGTRRRSRTSSARSRCFRSSGAAHYALARSVSRPRPHGRRPARAGAHADSGARWPALDDPVLAAVHALRDDAGALLQRGVKLADAGDVAGAIAAHEGGAGARSVARAGAREPDLALRPRAQLVEGRGALSRRSCARRRRRRRALRLRRAARPAGEMGSRGGDAYRQALAVNPLHAHAQQPRTDPRAPAQLDAAADAYRQAVESQPDVPARALQSRAHADRARTGRRGDRRAREACEPRDAEAPRYLFALATAHVRAGRRDEGIKWATDAKAARARVGQQELAAAIDRDLARLMMRRHAFARPSS